MINRSCNLLISRVTQSSDQGQERMEALNLHPGIIEPVHQTFVDQDRVKTAEDGQLGGGDRSGRLEQNLCSSTMGGVAEDRVSGSVEVPLDGGGIEAAEEPKKAVRTTAVHRPYDGARAESKKSPSNLRHWFAA